MLEDRLDAVETHPLLVVDVGKGPEDHVDDLVDQETACHLLDQHEGQHEQQRHEKIPEERPVVRLAEHHRPAHQIAAEQLGEGDPDEGDPVGAVRDEKRERHPEAVKSDEDVDRADAPALPLTSRKKSGKKARARRCGRARTEARPRRSVPGSAARRGTAPEGRARSPSRWSRASRTRLRLPDRRSAVRASSARRRRPEEGSPGAHPRRHALCPAVSPWFLSAGSRYGDCYTRPRGP